MTHKKKKNTHTHTHTHTKTQIHKVSYFKIIAQYFYYQSYDLHLFQYT